jgi:hypothetical protein
MKPYSRRTYHSRGKLPFADRDTEITLNKKCAVCGATLIRKTNKNGNLEQRNNFLKRQTCGRDWNEDKGKFIVSKCYKKFITGKGNPNYKGLMPKCIDCGKKMKSYGCKNKVQPKRCKKCFNKFVIETDYFHHTEGLKKIVERMKSLKGIVPESLKPYQWVKGQPAHNKKFDFCQIKGCREKHLARGLCVKHYARFYKSNLLF